MPSYPRYDRTDSLKPVYDHPKKKKSALEWILFGVFGLMLVIGALALFTLYAPSFKKVPNRVAEGFKADRINILLIGVGGPTHPGEGKDLADAIMMLSLKPSRKEAALMSIPRDLYIPIWHYGPRRLNSAHEIGENNGYPGGGPKLLMDSVEQVTGQSIHAFIRLDFAAFEKVIDTLGGVDVYVYRPFYDYLFKDRFVAGWQHMDGKRALRFARLRYVDNSGEGNNFGRELRQQQVINALREKVHNLSPTQALQIVKVATTVSHYTETNLTTPQMIELYSTFNDMPRQNIRHISLAPFLDIFNVTNPVDPGEAVRPRAGNWSEVQKLARAEFTTTAPVVTADEIPLTPPPPKPDPVPESVGLASTAPTRY